ncbi:hypothetical protein [Mesorhizobium sp.]|nr:hypothetical protein [Mesorhizobium sp.]
MKMEIRRLFPADDALVMRVAENVFDEPVRLDYFASWPLPAGQ